MHLAPYRRVLSVPGVRALLLLGFFARIPATAVGIALTLHVVNALHRSYGAAGLVTACYTVGMAASSPVIGRFIDRRGARPVLAVTTLVQTACWLAAPMLPYEMLLGAAVLAGVFGIPVWGLIRQSLSAVVPEAQRRPAFALDSMAVEVSFMIGPAAAVALATALPTGLAIELIGVGLLLSGGLLFTMNPPTRPDDVTPGAVMAPRRSWLGPRLVAVLVATCAATFILSGTDLTIVASLRQAHATSLTGVVIALWCGYSLLGGLVFGAVHRPVSVLALVAAMGLLTIPVGLAASWPVLCLALIPAGVLPAPTIAAGNDMLSRLVPAQSRGEAIGLLSSALTAGTSLGAPFAGLVIDNAGPHWAFVAAGAAGALAVVLAYPAYRRQAPGAGRAIRRTPSAAGA
jgi:MFS family permease